MPSRTITLCVLAPLWIGGCSLATPAWSPPSAAQVGEFSIVEHLGGTPVNKVLVTADSPFFNELMNYIHSKDFNKGAMTLVSYVPSLQIQCDFAEINIQKSTVVVSTRNSVDAAWNQVVRSKSPEDSRIESSVRACLHAGHS